MCVNQRVFVFFASLNINLYLVDVQIYLASMLQYLIGIHDI